MSTAWLRARRTQSVSAGLEIPVPGRASLRTVVAGVKAIEVKGVADLDGKTIGTTRGTTHDTWLTQNAKNAKIVRYEDDATEAQAFAVSFGPPDSAGDGTLVINIAVALVVPAEFVYLTLLRANDAIAAVEPSTIPGPPP